MRLIYTPEGKEPMSWEFQPEKLMSPEAEAIERQTGWTFMEWGEKLAKGSFVALHALLWVLLKRTEPTLPYDAVEFAMSELDFEDDEKAPPKGEEPAPNFADNGRPRSPQSLASVPGNGDS